MAFFKNTNQQVHKRSVWTIISTYHPIMGGSEFSAHRLSRKLIENGWKVRVITRRHGAKRHGLASRTIVDGVPVIRIWCRGRMIGTFFFLLGGLLHLVYYGRGDIYHAHDIAISSWIAVLARRLFGGYAIIKMRTGKYRYEKLFSSFLKISSRLSRWYFVTPLRLANKVIVVNSEVEIYAKSLGIKPDSIVRIPNAVDSTYFCLPNKEKKIKARCKIHLASDKSIFLYVGRLNEIKGADVLLEGWSILPDYIRDKALLVLVADDSSAGEFKKKISNEIRKSIIFAGKQKNVRDYYWAADVFVLASRTEGISNALLEAMACGLPVVASAVGGTVDTVTNNVNGLLFDSENSNHLAQQIVSIIGLKEQWSRMGINSRSIITRYMDIDVCTRKIEDLYDSLLDAAS